MAEEKNRPKEKPDSKDKKGGKGQDIAKSIVIRLFNQGKKPAARFLARYLLTPEQRIKIARNENPIETAAMILAMITPHEGLWELTDDVMQDFVHEVVLACQEMVSAGNEAPSTHSQAAVQQTAPDFAAYLKIQMVADQIADPVLRDRFLMWYERLAADRRSIFHRLVVEGNPAPTNDELKAIMQRHPQELNRMIDMAPKAAPAPEPEPNLDLVRLQDAVRNDEVLYQQVKDFLEDQWNAGHDYTGKFWPAVGHEIHTLEAMRELMDMPDDLIVRRLRLDAPPVKERIGEFLEGMKDLIQPHLQALGTALTEAKTEIGQATQEAVKAGKELGQMVAKGVDALDKSTTMQQAELKSAAFRDRWKNKK